MDAVYLESPSPANIPDTLPRATRTWPAAVLLFFLAPMMAEMLSGSTPPLMFINPFSLVLQTGLYGCGALVVREAVRRRGLGWPSILALGAAYGILEEGLTLTTWFNPYWTDVQPLGAYGRVLETNWVWAVALTTFHAVFSITIPIIIVESLFPRIAARPWLSDDARVGMTVWLGIVSTFTLVVFGFLIYNQWQCTMTKGVTTCLPPYGNPPLMWFGALALAVGLVVIALWLRPPAPRGDAASAKRAPGLWRLRLFGLFCTIIFFALQWAGPSLIPPALLTTLLILALDGLVAWRIVRWSARAGWGAEQRLALAIGGASFFLLLAPLLELHPAAGKFTTGMTLAAAGWLIFFFAVSLRLGRASHAALPPPAPLPERLPVESALRV